jgi:hypothetical protein
MSSRRGLFLGGIASALLITGVLGGIFFWVPDQSQRQFAAEAAHYNRILDAHIDADWTRDRWDPDVAPLPGKASEGYLQAIRNATNLVGPALDSSRARSIRDAWHRRSQEVRCGPKQEETKSPPELTKTLCHAVELPPRYDEHPVFSWFDAETCQRFSASQKVFDLIDLSSRRTDVRSMFWMGPNPNLARPDLETIRAHLIPLAMFFNLRQEVLLETHRQELALENFAYILRFSLDLVRGVGDPEHAENASRFVDALLAGLQDAVYRGRFSRDELRATLIDLQRFSASLTQLRFARWFYLHWGSQLAADLETVSAGLVCRNDRSACLRSPWTADSLGDAPMSAPGTPSELQRPDWITYADAALQLRAIRGAMTEIEAQPLTRPLGETQEAIDMMREKIADDATLWSVLAIVLPDSNSLQETLDSLRRTDEGAFAFGGLRRNVDMTIWQIAAWSALDEMGVKKGWATDKATLKVEIDRILDGKTPADPITGLPFSLEKSESGWTLQGPSSHGLSSRSQTCLRIHP